MKENEQRRRGIKKRMGKECTHTHTQINAFMPYKLDLPI